MTLRDSMSGEEH